MENVYGKFKIENSREREEDLISVNAEPIRKILDAQKYDGCVLIVYTLSTGLLTAWTFLENLFSQTGNCLKNILCLSLPRVAVIIIKIFKNLKKPAFARPGMIASPQPETTIIRDWDHSPSFCLFSLFLSFLLKFPVNYKNSVSFLGSLAVSEKLLIP